MKSHTTESYLRIMDKDCRAKNPAAPEDYERDGLLYCGRCHTPRETVIAIPNTDRTMRGMILCRCRAEQSAKEREAEQRAAAEEHRKQALPHDKSRAMTIESSDCKLKIAEAYIAQWERMYRDNVGLLLHGPTGSGKTYIAAAIANALVDRGEWVYMDNFASIANDMRDTYKGGHDFIVSRAQIANLLVLDDFGSECTSDYSIQNIYELIEARIESGKPLIVTTNFPPDKLVSGADLRLQRLYSRLTSLHPVGIDGADRRKKMTRDRYNEINALLGVERTAQ